MLLQYVQVRLYNLFRNSVEHPKTSLVDLGNTTTQRQITFNTRPTFYATNVTHSTKLSFKQVYYIFLLRHPSNE